MRIMPVPDPTENFRGREKVCDECGNEIDAKEDQYVVKKKDGRVYCGDCWELHELETPEYEPHTMYNDPNDGRDD